MGHQFFFLFFKYFNEFNFFLNKQQTVEKDMNEKEFFFQNTTNFLKKCIIDVKNEKKIFEKIRFDKS